MRIPSLNNSCADISHSQQYQMSSIRLSQSGLSIEEEIRITVGEVQYLLIPHQEVVIASRSEQSQSANFSRTSSAVKTATLLRWSWFT
jgi:hypothetical protein